MPGLFRYLATAALLAACAAACACVNGGNRVAADRCLCSCPRGYYPPTCAYTATTQVQVYAEYTNTSANRFSSSGRKVLAFYDQYGLNDTTVAAAESQRRLIRQEPADGSRVMLIILFRGDVVDRIVSSFDANSAFATSNALVALRYYDPPAAEPGPFADSPVLGSFSVGESKVDIDLAALSFLFGAIAVIIVVPATEGCFGCCCAGKGRAVNPSEEDARIAAFRERRMSMSANGGNATAKTAAPAPPPPEAQPVYGNPLNGDNGDGDASVEYAAASMGATQREEKAAAVTDSAPASAPPSAPRSPVPGEGNDDDVAPV